MCGGSIFLDVDAVRHRHSQNMLNSTQKNENTGVPPNSAQESSYTPDSRIFSRFTDAFITTQKTLPLHTMPLARRQITCRESASFSAPALPYRDFLAIRARNCKPGGKVASCVRCVFLCAKKQHVQIHRVHMAVAIP